MTLEYFLHEFAVMMADLCEVEILQVIPDGGFSINLMEDYAVVSFSQFGEIVENLGDKFVFAHVCGFPQSDN